MSGLISQTSKNKMKIFNQLFRPMKLAIIGDYNSQYNPHKATNEAIAHSVRNFEIPLQYDWISTAAIDTEFEKIISIL